ncbi:DUF421 domain-containing protein [Companilactobacillus sp.]|jgi:uncharacterized membrane protein YcaP (DUF421 family)|uniref:DUF421 domain-containing protein n=1 Tax=Companilactobacillus sp. TaxID=2767905 RepID=UPI0025BE6371|nr:DUF421 domain-containing protein [Companilactobacillus sp.]MCH4008908.1 DUF421 domain-containing protein [Companilactobacillus sp.]MCH4050913.1 DUF421 domain-containing protein [Companilactobacillus sp.]MCH4076851.1 DUF421 domain-containing protein [Companilactobacillus sp.]MCH4125426.1 DUF421 domain-containing protein [Companilactobacillus sp.]MCH4131968.1 DUF421 domain-containing protein [Companilactobacillus sp.]
MDLSYGDLALKFTVGFIFMVLQINLFGKGNLAPTNAIDALQNYVLGGIVGGMIYNQQITLLQFTMVLLIWTLIVFIAKFLTNHNNLFKKIIDGTPKLIVSNGKIDVDLALKNGLSANDLSFKLRQSGVNDIRDVKRAVFEQNGQLTIVMKNEENIKYPIVLDGKINQDELEILDKDQAWVEEKLAAKNLKLSEVYLANYIDGKVIAYKY